MANGADTDVSNTDAAADAAAKKIADVDTSANDGSDEPKTYSVEAYNKVKAESIARREKIDKLTKSNTDLTGEVDALSGKVKKLATLISGDDPEDSDSDSDLDAIESRFKAESAKMENMIRKSLLKSQFFSESSKYEFHDPAFAFASLDLNDERLKVSLEDQSVEGMDVLLNDLIKKAPFLIKSKTKEPASRSAGAPGSRSPSETKNPSDKEALEKIQKEGEKISGEEGAVYILLENAKLRAK